MDIGLIGLGKMGARMAGRLVADGHRVVGYDINVDVALNLDDRIELVGTIADLPTRLSSPRVIWLMLPPGKATDRGIAMVLPSLDRGDLVIDGGNSDFRDAGRRGELLRNAGCRFMDVGVSGGVWGHINGYGITAGGDDADVAAVSPVLASLAAEGVPFHVGPAGAGHYAKMVHNAVEYAVMQAYAEGFELLTASELGVDVAKTFEAWQTGCSIRSWLLGQMVIALNANPSLAGVPPRAGDSGMGRWAVEESVRLGVPVPGIAAALFARFGSQREDSPSMQAIAALRQQVGGHVAPPATRDGVLR